MLQRATFKTHSLHWPCQTVSLMYCRLFTNGSRQSWHRCWAVEESSAAQTPCSFMVINETPAHRAPLSASTDHFGLWSPLYFLHAVRFIPGCSAYLWSALSICTRGLFYIYCLWVWILIIRHSLPLLQLSLPLWTYTSRIIERNAPVLHEVGLRSRLVLARVLVVNV